MSSTSNGLKKICVVTGTRAEYGLLSNVMHEIKNHPALELQLVACAAHLSKQHGMTVNQIIDDGFEVNARVEMLENQDGRLAMVKAVAKGVAGFADAYESLQPDCVLLLGDRYEILAAAETALLMDIPIAHIHGGEVTEGAVDEAIRHAITKMATLHFTAAENYRNRVIQMGELPENVFNVGAPGLDLIHQMSMLPQSELEKDLNLKLNRPVCLVTYHPVTWNKNKGIQALTDLFLALEEIEDATVVWTGANADEQGQQINALVEDWIKNTPLNAKFVTSLGSKRYLSLMALADVVVGNSSSGIIEAPAMGTPTVNIGSRQQGRLRSPSILDCQDDQASIANALTEALSDSFQVIAQKKQSVYGSGQTAQLICNKLANFPFGKRIGKPFYDLPNHCFTS
ncbi:MAG: UDP-N-acetylglucosamine 2-epimerase [Pseudomonadota bacterium]|nr:UDP-N-acetylglucosamine 2-epimerase [Pseudomonadota bacterium]